MHRPPSGVRSRLASSALVLVGLSASCSYFAVPQEQDADAGDGGPPSDRQQSALLQALWLHDAPLDPAFDPAHIHYDASVAWSPTGQRLRVEAQFDESRVQAELGWSDRALPLRSRVPSEQLDVSRGPSQTATLTLRDSEGRVDVYVMTIVAATPQVQRLKGSPARRSAQGGAFNALAMDPTSSTIAVGAEADGTADAGLPQQGACTVFGLGPSGWVQTARYEGTGGARLGAAVALSDRHLAVGAPGQGTVRIFAREAAIFESATASLDLPTTPGYFGSAVAFAREDLLLVGARATSGPMGAVDAGADASAPPGVAAAGMVHTYRHRDGGWASPSAFHAPEPHENARFGAVVAGDSEHVVVGAPGDDLGEADLGDSGAVYLYRTHDLEEAAPRAVQRLTAPTPGAGMLFGSSLIVDHDLLVIGAPGTDQGTGAAYAYRWNTSEGVFQLEQELKISGERSDRFGVAVASGDGVVYVAAHGEDGSLFGGLTDADNQSSDSGAIYTFTRDAAGRWLPRGYLKANDNAAGLNFGAGLRVSNAGFVASAPGDSRTAEGAPSESRSGVLYVFPP